MLNSHIHLDFDNVNTPSAATTGAIVPSTGKDNWDSVIQCCEWSYLLYAQYFWAYGSRPYNSRNFKKNRPTPITFDNTVLKKITPILIYFL
jgi:hypothetical protein